MKSMMVELTDDTNMARGFSLIAVTYSVGATLGSDTSLPSSACCPADIGPSDPSSVVCYLGHKIIGQICFRIHSGAHTRISCHVSPPPRMVSCH